MRSGFLSGRRRGCMWLLIGEDAQGGSWNLVGVVGNEVVRVGKEVPEEEAATPPVGSTTSSTTLAVVSKSNLSKIREFRKVRLPSTPWKIYRCCVLFPAYYKTRPNCRPDGNFALNKIRDLVKMDLLKGFKESSLAKLDTNMVTCTVFPVSNTKKACLEDKKLRTNFSNSP